MRVSTIFTTDRMDFGAIFQQINLRWLKTVSSSYLFMGRYIHSLALDVTIMISENCPTIGEHVVIIFVSQ